MARLATILLLTTVAAGVTVPPENRDASLRPDAASAEAGAQRLLEALKTGDPAKAADFFFPKDAFDQVKDLPVPERYHRKLLGWYEEDIKKEHSRFKSGNWQLRTFELGRCKWKEAGTEGNKLPYWSCRGNFVTATDGTKTRRFEINVLINWGKTWYITHLGPMRSN